jgi:hypothetical protein
MWAEAQANAARLSGLSRDLGGSRALIVHVPFAELGHVADHAAQAAAYDREHNIVLFRDDRPWQSDRGHHAAIVIHEAVHTLQPDDMPKRLSRAAGLCRAGRMAARAGRVGARRRNGAPWVALSLLGAPRRGRPAADIAETTNGEHRCLASHAPRTWRVTSVAGCVRAASNSDSANRAWPTC